MNDRFNTIAGWVLGGGIVLLGGTLVAGEVFRPAHQEQKGYPIEGVVEAGGSAAEADPPIAVRLASADLARGENAFKKCSACHTIAQGGATGIGPNLWGIMGAPHAHIASFNYSDAMRAHTGPWNWDEMDQWLRRPSAYAPGTKMTFAGLSNAQERADLILYLNAQGSNLPLPAPPAAGEAPAAEGDAAANGATPAGNAAAPTTTTGNAAAATPEPGAATKGGGEAQPAAANPAAH